MTDPNTTTPATLRADALDLLREIAARKRYDPNVPAPWGNNSGWNTIILKSELLARVDALLDAAAAAPAVEPIRLVHVALAEDGGNLRWMTGRKPRDCELYMMPDGGRAPAVVYATRSAPVAEYDGNHMQDRCCECNDYEAECRCAEPSEIEQVIACLGDDAAKLREANPNDEIADNMEAAARMLSERVAVSPAAADELAALREMLDDARNEFTMVREALGVAYEPHQTLLERTLDAARASQAAAPAPADERPAFDAWLAAEYPDVAAAMKNEFTNPDVVESVDMARAAWDRASRPAAPADAISLLRKAHSTLASAALTQIRDGEAVWTEIGRFLDAAPAETRKTCMCSGLGPCERRTDGSCRVSAPANLASAVSRQVVIDWAVDRWTLEVSGRPLGNIHRRSLDDAWRQFIRHLGADDVSLLGPRHDDLIAAHSLSIPLPDSEGGEA